MTDVRRFSGQQDGEEVRLFLRRHPMSLAWSLRWAALGLAGVVLALVILGGALAPLGALVGAVTLLAALALGLAAVWAYALWYYDVYLVTDLRLLDFARRPFIYERRDEAQLSKVQDIRVEYPNPVALLLDFGHVKVQTAGSRGGINFASVPRPKQVQARILGLAAAAHERAMQAAASTGGAEAGQMRQFLGLEPEPRTETSAATPGPRAAPSPSGWRGYARGLFRPRLDLKEGDLVWRKHWWALMGTTVVSGAIFNSGLLLGALMIWQAGLTPWLALPLALVLVGGVWNLWHVIDWQNDLYVVTDDRIIDIEKVPLISEDRREARLYQIQDVHYVMPGFINRFLDFGNVEVETAGRGGGFSFGSVPHPREVQAEIFRRVERARRAAAQSDHERREDDALSLLYRYHQAGQPGAD